MALHGDQHRGFAGERLGVARREGERFIGRRERVLPLPDGEIGRVWALPKPLVYRALTTLQERGLVATAGEEPAFSPSCTRVPWRCKAPWVKVPVSLPGCRFGQRRASQGPATSTYNFRQHDLRK